jgi:competence protein ComEC
MPEFLAAVQPRIAIISVEFHNPYGHPSPELLERLEQASVRILRSDRDGAVHVLTDGKQTAVSCYVACAEPGSAANSGQTQFPNQQ